MRTHHHQLVAVVLLCLACGRPTPQPQPVEVKPEPQAPEMSYQGLSGLTVVPGTHERLWLEPRTGVGDGKGKTVFADPTVYNDVVALDDQRIALIMQNDGFVYELATHKLLSRFCYLPDSLPMGTVQTSF